MRKLCNAECIVTLSCAARQPPLPILSLKDLPILRTALLRIIVMPLSAQIQGIGAEDLHRRRRETGATIGRDWKDLRKVSLWLGHAQAQTTEMYTRVDSSVKLEALESVVPPKLRSGRFKATDKLITSLKAAT